MVTDQGVAIRVWDWSETSQTAAILTRGLGMVRVVAKGSRRPNSKFSGGLEVLTRAEVIVSTRTLEKDTPGLAILASWDLLETFPGATRSLLSFHAGMAMLDLVQHAIQDADPHPRVFDALVLAMRELARTTPLRALAPLAWAILDETGHAPELELDIRTGGPLQVAPSYAFLPRRGGFTRDDLGADPITRDAAQARGPAETTGPSWRTRALTLETLRAIAKGHDIDGLDAEGVTRAAKLLLSNYREVFACDPVALRQFMERAFE